MLKSAVFGTVFEELRPYRWRVVLLTVLRSISELLWLAHPYLLGLIMTEAAKGTALNFEYIWTCLGLIVLNFILRLAFQRTGNLVTNNVRSEVEYAMHRRGIQKMMQYPLSWHEAHHTGTKIPVLSRATRAVGDFLLFYYGVVLEMIVTVTGTFIIVASFDKLFIAHFAVYAVLSFSLLFFIRKKLRKLTKEKQKVDNKLAAENYEALHNVHTVFAAGAFQGIDTRLSGLNAEGLRHAKSANALNQGFWYLFNLLWLVFFALMLMIAIPAVAAGTMFVGMVASLTFYFRNIDQTMSGLSEGIQNLMVASVSLEEYQKLLAPTERRMSGDEVINASWKTLEVKDVEMKYGEKEVLHGVSMQIKRGEKVGIVGLSGSGKSSYLSLLGHLRPVDSGFIGFDEQAFETILEEDYRAKVGVALQDTEVFQYSFAENIRLAAPAGTDEEYTALIEEPWLKSILSRLTEGDKTLVGEKGVKLSGGERQRLGIARALIKKPELLLLDEATSHLDSHTEEEVQKTIEALEGVTVVAVAHRLSTLRNFDRIFVMEHGKIAEEGSWEELLANKGAFAALKERQDSESKTEDTEVITQ